MKEFTIYHNGIRAKVRGTALALRVDVGLIIYNKAEEVAYVPLGCLVTSEEVSKDK